MRKNSLSYVWSLKKVRIAAAVLAVLLLWFWIYQRLKADHIREHGVIVQALVTEWLPPGKAISTATYRCEFYYNGELKSLLSSSSVREEKRSYVRQTYPALYSAKYDAVQLLLNSQDSFAYIKRP